MGSNIATIQSINPATLDVNTDFPVTPVNQVASIVMEAREAQRDWSAISTSKRGEYLARVKDYVLNNSDQIARIITQDNGKTLLEAINSEVYPVLDMYTFCAREAPQLLEDEPLRNPMFSVARLESKNAFEPKGVVGIISPWNFPFAIPMTQIAMALIAGNTVVLKPAEITPMVGDLIAKIFRESGVPEGIVRVIQGTGAEVGEALVAARPDHLVFTGSVRTGRHLLRRLADVEPMISLTLELGGKDPAIVLEDADIERAAAGIVWGSFINAGQVCASVERVYVHEKIADDFIKAVVDRTRALRIGDGMKPTTDMGPLTFDRQHGIVESHVADAISKGATIETGGHKMEDLPGWFYAPTVITGADHSMKCMTEETFGPTMPIMRFSRVEDAINLANDSKYGLTASVWSKDLQKAESVARAISTGTVVLNNCLLTYGFSQCPWGGVKDSGIGRTHSVHGLYEFTNIKNITTNKGLLNQDLWWHPYSDTKYRGMKAAMKTMFCDGVMCKAEGIIDIFKSFDLLKKK